MDTARRDGLCLLFLGVAFFLVVAALGESIGIAWMVDFKAVYYSGRCLLQNADPYNSSDVLRVYDSQPSEDLAAPTHLGRRQAITFSTYPPSTYLVLAPFAALPWVSAHIFWMVCTGASLLLAVAWIWKVGSESSPLVTGALLGLILVNSTSLLMIGNTAGIAVSLCTVAALCFLRQRFAWIGILSMALSLAIKPHDAGFVWLYFLLAGGTYRKRALQSLAVTAVISLTAVLWVSHVSPHWMREMRANLQTTSAPGGRDNPEPSVFHTGSVGMIIDLQTITSEFTDNANIYNRIAYSICGVFLLLLAVTILRSPASQDNSWFALASVAAFTMLPIYHRTHDAKLLLIAIPACAILAAEGMRIGRIAVALTCLGVALTGDIPTMLLVNLAALLHISTAGLAGKIATIVLARPAPLFLFAMGVFYLWIYIRRTSGLRQRELAVAAVHGSI